MQYTAEQTFGYMTRFLAPKYTVLPKDDCIALKYFGDRKARFALKYTTLQAI